MKVICDTESDGLLYDATRIWCVAAIDSDTGTEYFFGPDELEKFEEWAKGVTQWIGHNFLSFDWPLIEKFTKVRIPLEAIEDTLILSRLAFTGKINRHSLEAWGERIGHPKVEHEDWTKYTEDMKTRCVEDTRLNFKLWKILKKELKAFSTKCVELEHQTQHILNLQKANGFPLNIDKAYKIYDECKGKADTIEKEIQAAFPPQLVLKETYTPNFTKDGEMYASSTSKIARFAEARALANGDYGLYELETFNLGSPKQIIERLNGYGWKPRIKTKTGNPQLCEENLETLPADAPPAARKLVEWWMLRNRVTVLKGWFDAYNPATRSIHGTAIAIGAITHRMAHYDPQMANIPAIRSPYGMELRSCLYAGDDDSYVQLGCDISGIQLCILAHYLNDLPYTEAIAKGVKENGTDIHSVNMRILQEVVPSVDRDASKKFIYSMLLGAGGYKLGLDMGTTAQAGNACKERLFSKIPAFKRVRKMCETAAQRGYMLGIDGRRVPIKSEHYALSVYLQCGEAIIMKQALVYTHERATHLEWKQMAVVHDEIQARVKRDHAKELGEIMRKAITDAGVLFGLRCPLDGNYKIGKDWAECH